MVQTLLSAFSQGTQLKLAFDHTVTFGVVGQVEGAWHDGVPVALVELIELVPLFHLKYSQADPTSPHSAFLTVVQSMASTAGSRRTTAKSRDWIFVILLEIKK